jgi:5-methylcytosine-specific restriction endonuclease McrA
MTIKAKKLRKRLVKTYSFCCYYCGLPFGTNPIQEGQPYYRKFKNNARMTLEHLVAVSNGGKTNEENCVLSHAWCNSNAHDISPEEKASLRAKLRKQVEETGMVPWFKKAHIGRTTFKSYVNIDQFKV